MCLLVIMENYKVLRTIINVGFKNSITKSKGDIDTIIKGN